MKKILVVAALTLTALHAPACGPFFDYTYVVAASPEEVLRLPELFLMKELKKRPAEPKPHTTGSILPAGVALDRLCGFELATGEDRYWAEDTIDSGTAAEMIDLYIALIGSGVENVSATELCRNYFRIRAGFDARVPTNWIKPEKLPLDDVFVTLGRLPREFQLYTLGASAFHQQKYGEAKANFESILALPPGQRRYKTTWARFMIGRLATMARRDPELAAAHPEIATDPLPYFEQVRADARDGFLDTDSLVGGTYQQEALLAAAAGDAVREFHLLVQYNLFGDNEASWLALKLATMKLLDGDSVPPELIADPLSRSVLAAFAASHVESYPTHAERVLVALNCPNATLTPYESARLAWTACALGRMDEAATLVGRAPEEPYALWTDSRLRLRKGDLEGATGSLRKAVPMFTRDETWWLNDQSRVWSYHPFEALHNEQGVLLLARSRYVEALELFLTGKSWMDAAYIAEHVLTLDELLVYYQRCQSEGLHRERTSVFWGNEAYGEPPVGSECDGALDSEAEGVPLIERLQSLVGRRMLREGRYNDAPELFPKTWRHLADAYAQHVTKAFAAPDSRQRAFHLVQSAHLLRLWGIELIGFETDPDFAYVGGAFYHENTSWARARTDRWHSFAKYVASQYDAPLSSEYATNSTGADDLEKLFDLVRPSDDEQRRLDSDPSKNYSRWHYRFVAADLYEQAIALLPNQSKEKAQALFYCAKVLEKVDSAERLDIYYKALVRQCGKLEIGKAADRKRWFPDEPEAWAVAFGPEGIDAAARNRTY